MTRAVVLAGGASLALAAAAFFVVPLFRPAGRHPTKNEWFARMMEVSTPGAAHERLAPLAGEFDVVMTVFGLPDGPPREERGSATKRLVLDGRYVEETLRLTLSGIPYEGRGFLGYDNARGRYVLFWMDNLSTRARALDGAFDAGREILVLDEIPLGGGSGGREHLRAIVRVDSELRHVVELHVVAPDGTLKKSEELVYLRTSPR